MTLADYLCEEAICVDLQTAEREESIRALLATLVAGNRLGADLVEPALQAILEREKLGSTAIGRGVAVPHARLDELGTILVAFGYSEQGVEFRALDGEPVNQIFLVIASKDHTEDYIALMERITRLVQNDDFRRFVAQTSGAQEVIELIREMDG